MEQISFFDEPAVDIRSEEEIVKYLYDNIAKMFHGVIPDGLVQIKPAKAHTSIVYRDATICRVKGISPGNRMTEAYISVDGKFVSENYGYINIRPSEAPYVRLIVVSKEKLVEALAIVKESAKAAFLSVAPEFSCCSLYQQCSDAGKCVNSDPIMGLVCSYHRKLMAGINYYSKGAQD